MTRRIIVAIALSLSFVFTVPVFAQDKPDSEKVALIKKLFVLMDIKNMQESIMASSWQDLEEQIMKGMTGTMGDPSASKEQKDALERVMLEYSRRISTKFQVRLKEKVNIAELTERVIVPIYDKNFSAAEIKDLIAFYETPTGQKMVKSMPQMTQETMQKTMEVVMPQIMQIMSEVSEEEKGALEKMMKDAGFSSEPPPPPPPAPKTKKPIKKR